MLSYRCQGQSQMIIDYKRLTNSDPENDSLAKKGVAEESVVEEEDSLAEDSAAQHRGGPAECCDTDVMDKVG